MILRRLVMFGIGFCLLVSSMMTAGGASLLESLSLGLEKDIGYATYQDVMSEKKPARFSNRERTRLEMIFSRVADGSGRKKEIKYSLTVVIESRANNCKNL